MDSVWGELTRNFELTNNLRDDIYSFLNANHCPKTAKHCMDVGAEARRVALLFHADPAAAEIAGWLHGISAVFPNQERIAVARRLDIEVLPEEEVFPMIIHQKLAKAMARDIFKISNEEILDAVGCHTTLRANSTKLDQVLFVADKIAWDQSGEPPYLHKLRSSLDRSLTHGAFAYIDYLWERKDSLQVIHPWLRDAYEELKGIGTDNIFIKRTHDLSLVDTSELIQESSLAGYRHIARLVEEYRSGTNTFDKSGEMLLGAYDHRQLIGVCGLNQDPYNEHAGIGRLRRMYVLEKYRRRGIAKRLVDDILNSAQDHFQVIILYTDNKDAAKFYESIGFKVNQHYVKASHYVVL